jgi:hypothetical protein
MTSFLKLLAAAAVTSAAATAAVLQENLADHLSNPTANNAVTNIAGPNLSKIIG